MLTTGGCQLVTCLNVGKINFFGKNTHSCVVSLIVFLLQKAVSAMIITSRIKTVVISFTTMKRCLIQLMAGENFSVINDPLK